jgi:hypothetical protein
VCQKRIAATKTNLEEQSDMGKYITRKFKEPVDCALALRVLAGVDDIPRLATSAGVNRSEIGDSGPLQLPPLKIKPVRARM